MMRCNFKVQNFEDVKLEDLIKRTTEFKNSGHRLCQLCATNVKGGTEMLYSFDKEQELFNIKIFVPDGTEIPSITGIYWPAFVYENETHDLFGIGFSDSKLDYKGNYFKVSKPTPWRKTEEGGE